MDQDKSGETGQTSIKEADPVAVDSNRVGSTHHSHLEEDV